MVPKVGLEVGARPAYLYTAFMPSVHLLWDCPLVQWSKSGFVRGFSPTLFLDKKMVPKVGLEVGARPAYLYTCLLYTSSQEFVNLNLTDGLR